MKKNIILSASAILIGLVMGYFIFGNSTTKAEHEHTKTITESGEEVWTCPMHPQIRVPEFGQCPICKMDLIKEDKTSSNSNPLVFEMSENAVKIVNIQTTIVGSSSTSNDGLKLSGKIMVNESTTASVVSHIPGRIEKLYVSFTGEKIRKHQKIATIYSPNLITAQKELLEAYKIKDVNPALFQATKNKLKYWKISESQINKIIDNQSIEENIAIYSHHSGIVKTKRVSVGDHLMEGGVLFDIQNLNNVWGVFDVYETDLQHIKLGNSIEFTTPSLPNQVFNAKIVFIDPIINPQTRVASVRVNINNSKRLLKPEMFINGSLTTKTLTLSTQIVIPKSAVLWTGERSVVYLKLKDTEIPSFEFKEVTLGNEVGQNYIILNGLQQGDEVVTNGAFVIDASAQLNNQSSMMNRDIELPNNSNEMKCEAGKCGASMKEEVMHEKETSEMKCAPGKCGGGM